MRFGVDIEISEPIIPKDYRRGFASLIKAAMSAEAKLYVESLYSGRTDKPFTFSVYFPDLKGSQNGKLNVGKKAIINFSTSDHELLIYLYNGFRKLKEHQWKEYKLTLQNTRAFFNKEIKSHKVVFKTLSPFLVNQKEDNLMYLSVDDDGFDEALRHSVMGINNTFLGIQEPDFDYKILKHKKMVVSHYNQYMTCNKGIIEMEAESEILNLLYDVGIGVRRSQGFGMLDLIREEK